jgi:hypothetical protein
VLRSRDASLRSRCAFRFERATRAGARPIAAQCLAGFLVRIPISQLLARLQLQFPPSGRCHQVRVYGVAQSIGNDSANLDISCQSSALEVAIHPSPWPHSVPALRVRGIPAGCCALAATVHVAAAPPTKEMNSRRLMDCVIRSFQRRMPREEKNNITAQSRGLRLTSPKRDAHGGFGC